LPDRKRDVVRYRLTDLPEMLQTPIGRLQLRKGVEYRIWPFTSRLARLYRSTVVHRTRVIAVVGSLGKSTTLRAVSTVLSLPFHWRMHDNAWSSVAYAMLRVRPRQSHAAVEVGIADRGQMQAYARVVRPNVTVVTSIASEHHRSLGSLEVTRAEKAWMVRALLPSGTAVLNGDDPNVMWMQGQTRARTVTFGYGESCDVRAEAVRLDWPQGTRFRVRAFGQEREVAIRLLGRQMVYSALAAIAVSQLEGVPLDEALSRLKALAPTPGRMQPVMLPSGVLVLRDDFKSTLETMHAALDVFAEVPGRRIVVLGDVSEPPGRQRPIYQALGQRVGKIASYFVIVGHGLEPYHSGARRGGMPASHIIDGGRSPRQTAEALAGIIQAGDVVLLKGRDTQALDRVRLILEGRRVSCDIRFCNIHTVACEQCPMLERGWGTHRVIM
jgi:UDP-N-acetylmuramoyl-tripeptide--D-alanyl-D-alanine ligase